MNEYEELIKKGYEENGNIYIDVDDLTTLSLSESTISSLNNYQQRHDKIVILRDKNGNSKRISSIFMGKNLAGIKLGDGSYVNEEELITAINESIKSLDEGSIIISKTGKVLDESVLQDIVKNAAKIIVGEKNSKVVNQDSKNWSISGTDDSRVINKGIAFLGNNGIQLPSGTYVSMQEFLTALDDYLVLRPKLESTVNPTLEYKLNSGEKVFPDLEKISNQVEAKSQEAVIARVVRKRETDIKTTAACIALSAAMLVCIHEGEKNITKPDNLPSRPAIVETINYNPSQAVYNIHGVEVRLTYEDMEAAEKRVADSLNLGDMVNVENGDTFNTNSLLTGVNKTIGEEFNLENKFEGSYEITGFSLVNEGKVLTYIENFNQENMEQNLSSMIDEMCKMYNINYEDLQIRIHVGGNKDLSRCGWIDLKDLQGLEITPEVIGKYTIQTSAYSGIVNDFNGNDITINTQSGPVTLNVKDENGDYVKNGSSVIGSDGNTYVFRNFTVEEVNENNNVNENSNTSGKKTTFEVLNPAYALSLAPLAVALASIINNKKKNEAAQKNPKFFKFKNNKEYQQFKESFIEAKKRYEQKSKFGKMVKRIFQPESVDVLQKLTEDQVAELYNAIINHHSGDYSYSQEDKIQMRNGKIIVVFPDNREIDITDTILDSISSIGKDNKVAAVGLLEGENNGIQRR